MNSELSEAIIKGDLLNVKRLVEAKKYIPWWILSYVIHSKARLEVGRYLLDNGFSGCVNSKVGLSSACYENDVDLVELYMEYGGKLSDECIRMSGFPNNSYEKTLEMIKYLRLKYGLDFSKFQTEYEGVIIGKCWIRDELSLYFTEYLDWLASLTFSPPVKSFTYAFGDILTADVQYIVIPCSCTSVKHREETLGGLVSKKWSHLNPYAERRPVESYSHIYCVEDRDVPGTIRLLRNYNRGEDTGLFEGVICAFSQILLERPEYYSKKRLADIPYDDSDDARVRYFEKCLECISDLVPKPKSVGFPYLYKCSGMTYHPIEKPLWETIRQKIGEWAIRNPEIDVRIYFNKHSQKL